MAEKLMQLSGIGERPVALLYLELATASVLDYTNRIELLDAMQMLVIELASSLYQSKDREGIASRSEGAISESYVIDESGIPAQIRRRLERYRLIHGVAK